MIYPLVQKLNAKEGISIDLICAKMSLCKRAYFDWLKRPKCKREIEDEQILALIKAAHENDPAAGYRILRHDILDDLKAQGLYASKNRIAKICRQHNIFANHSNKHAKSTYKNAPKPSHDDLLRRKFKADKPNVVWVTDITEHPTREGKVYWCGFKDLCSNKIVGSAASNRMTASLAVDALNDALANRSYPKGVIVHSDRGSQYNSRQFLTALKDNGLTGSMGQVRTCADNAAMESFNALLQKNVFNQKRVWDSGSELIYEIYKWVNTRYNTKRRQDALGKMTPMEYELIYFGEVGQKNFEDVKMTAN